MIRIGITGHRILTEEKKIIRSLDFVFKKLLSLYPNEKWQILTSFAEGADCLAAERAMRFSRVEFLAVLPFEENRFLNTFSNDKYKLIAQNLLRSAKKILLPSQPNAELSYRAVGEYIVEHADLLIAIWDGKEAQGIGGAGEVVSLMREKRKPIAWIHAGNRLAGTLQPTTLGKEQGRVTFEQFPPI